MDGVLSPASSPPRGLLCILFPEIQPEEHLSIVNHPAGIPVVDHPISLKIG